MPWGKATPAYLSLYKRSDWGASVRKISRLRTRIMNKGWSAQACVLFACVQLKLLTPPLRFRQIWETLSNDTAKFEFSILPTSRLKLDFSSSHNNSAICSDHRLSITWSPYLILSRCALHPLLFYTKASVTFRTNGSQIKGPQIRNSVFWCLVDLIAMHLLHLAKPLYHVLVAVQRITGARWHPCGQAIG